MNYQKVIKIGDATLYLADAMDVLPNLKPVQCVCMDAPYMLTKGGKTGELGGVLSTENYSNDGAIVECNIDWDDFMPLIAGVVERGHIYSMCNDKNIRDMLNAAHKAKMHFHNMLVWDKITSMTNRWWMKNCEFTGMFSMGKAFPVNDCGKNQLVVCPPNKETAHPTEKPASLMEYYITNSTQKGDVVLDPFMGVGSTGIACARSGRKFIGIEIDERWFDIACERIENANKQGGLFL